MDGYIQNKTANIKMRGVVVVTQNTNELKDILKNVLKTFEEMSEKVQTANLEMLNSKIDGVKDNMNLVLENHKLELEAQASQIRNNVKTVIERLENFEKIESLSENDITLIVNTKVDNKVDNEFAKRNVFFRWAISLITVAVFASATGLIKTYYDVQYLNGKWKTDIEMSINTSKSYIETLKANKLIKRLENRSIE